MSRLPDYNESAMEQALRDHGYSEEHIALFRGNTTQEYRSRAVLKAFVIDQVREHGRILNKDFATHPDAKGMSVTNRTSRFAQFRRDAAKELGVTLVQMPGRKGWMKENNLEVLYEQLAAKISEAAKIDKHKDYDIGEWLNQYGQTNVEAETRLKPYGIHNVPGTTKYHEV